MTLASRLSVLSLVFLTSFAFADDPLTRSHERHHESPAPAQRPPIRPSGECVADETPAFFKAGPRSKVLDRLVDDLSREIEAGRARSPKKAKAVVEAEALESTAFASVLIENGIGFKEYEELVRRWNEKTNGNLEVVPRTNRDYQEHLRTAFVAITGKPVERLTTWPKMPEPEFPYLRREAQRILEEVERERRGRPSKGKTKDE